MSKKQETTTSVPPKQDEMRQINRKESANTMQNRSIYLLPNLFTTTNLFAGFYAIVASINGQYELSVLAIFIAMIMDTLDGRVARMTNTQSEFGAEFDSLSDMVAFGLAPSLVMYSWSLQDLGKIGWVAAFLYTATTALRLARFNTEQAPCASKKFFSGIPSPAAAAMLVSTVYLSEGLMLVTRDYSVLHLILTVVIALLMVSNFKYFSFKEFAFKQNISFYVLCAALLIFILIAIDPPKMLFIIFLTYVISGPLYSLFLCFKKTI